MVGVRLYQCMISHYTPKRRLHGRCSTVPVHDFEILFYDFNYMKIHNRVRTKEASELR